MPDTWPDYELLDFGEGRKLERFGDVVYDRPSPQAAGQLCAPPSLWSRANDKYTGAQVGAGKWRSRVDRTSSAPTISVPLDDQDSAGFQLQVERTPTGQVGLFPEQISNWRWIAQQCAKADQPLRVLNLFAYTGGSTLAAAAAGAEVTHVDASKPSVAMARRNAELSDLSDAPIKWIVEDVMKYCHRELRRGNPYHGIVLDPPTYGHGPNGEDWHLARDLPRLIELCRELTSGDRRFIVASCHTPGIGPAVLSAYLSDGIFGSCAQPPKSGRLQLVAKDGRKLSSGVYARWPG